MASVPHSERAAARRAAYDQGRALPPPSPGAAPGFPIQDASHWDKARQAVGRVQDPQRRAALGRLLRKTAPQFGRSQALKHSWAGGSAHAGDPGGIELAVRARLANGQMLTCPECGHVAPAGDFGTSGASLQRKPELLRTPQRGDVGSSGFHPGSAGIQVARRSAAHALAGDALGLELAGGTLTARRHAIRGPMDVLVKRGTDGTAVLTHRHGGTEIAQIRRDDGGRWIATVNGRDLTPREHQRTALMEAVGAWNGAVRAAVRPQDAPLQPPPVQTELMAEYGIPAIRALATPTAGAAAGPRAAMAGDDDAGLTPDGRRIRDRLKQRGIPHHRAVLFARRAQNMGKARAS